MAWESVQPSTIPVNGWGTYGVALTQHSETDMPTDGQPRSSLWTEP